LTSQQAAKLLGWAAFPDGWTFAEVKRAGQMVGFFCVKDNEIHAFRLPSHAGHWLTRQDIEAITTPLLARYGSVKTAVRSINQQGQRFVHRLGFERIDEVDGLIYYQTERLRHARL